MSTVVPPPLYRYVFVETQHSWVSKCVNETAAAYGYEVGPPLGDNKNRLLTRRSYKGPAAGASV